MLTEILCAENGILRLTGVYLLNFLVYEVMSQLLTVHLMGYGYPINFLLRFNLNNFKHWNYNPKSIHLYPHSNESNQKHQH